jgi:hypothetical protein
MSTPSLRLSPTALTAIVALALSLALAGVVSAAPLGKEGKIHACYRVKGKPKGVLRVVKNPRARCHRGERKVSWLLAGSLGSGGAPGAPGSSGAPGAPGAAGTGSALSRTELEERITVLTARVESLEGLLRGPVCDQLAALTAQTGALGEVIEGLGLNGVLTTLGGLLDIPELPDALPEFSCA